LDKYRLLNSQKSIYQITIDNIKVDFVHHPFKLIEPVYFDSGIKYLGLKDISAMKLQVIETSGDRAKDFIDIPKESWDEINYIGSKISKETIKKCILSAIKEYNDK